MYKIVEHDNIEDLEREVNELMGKGFTPLSGVSLVCWYSDEYGYPTRHWVYTQAVVKYASVTVYHMDEKGNKVEY